ncbi:ubiquinol-cytochrome c reductase iron-sulfur subunit [Alicyclobacillus macrosporangiidus]|uniref:Menaquinol-cytochrome c reductase iron-sulfur subunit n=1 Tax=Alicyclobacillus macrosporangiidus TaxID=392015 RepID=A0A1I7KU53_9BACL|nr:ubiquinol-cytochrome c reductase iron-sulfur subunit [Alicyclobacillus macrosporangiidus]SFV00918.1 menaquinol-cytochrome c reductase iron-sulfur subunit [Alicyclobacillus macrosporangiidus]
MSDFHERASREQQPGLSRRQFLTYALGGTGAFMASLVAVPFVVETFDPIRRGGANAFVNSGHKVSEFNKTLPQLVEFRAHRDDGWNSADIPSRAWVILQEDGSPLAMSPICTHLGCQVNGTLGPDGKPEPSQDGQWWFHCPCHGSKYTVYGIQSPGSPAPRPLDVHKVKVDEAGYLYLGPLQQRNSAGQVIS